MSAVNRVHTYKKDVGEGKGGDNKCLWWRECMMDRRGGSTCIA